MTTAMAFPSPDVLEQLAILGAKRLTVSQYHTMHDAGILMEGDRVELLDGYLVEKAMRNPPHDGVVTRLTNRLPRRVPTGWVTRIQSAVTFLDSEPEPDGAIVRGDDTSYDHHHPAPADFGIVLEISDSSLAFDRRVKQRLYATVGVPVYWIININDSQIEVYTNPQPNASSPSYLTRTDYVAGQSVPLVLDGVAVASIPMTDMLP